MFTRTTAHVHIAADLFDPKAWWRDIRWNDREHYMGCKTYELFRASLTTAPKSCDHFYVSDQPQTYPEKQDRVKVQFPDERTILVRFLGQTGVY